MTATTMTASPDRRRRRRYVALLRGVNVGRAKRITMADLRALVETLGHREVRTLLNSGNVIFTAGPGRTDLVARAIESALFERVGFESRVTVLEAARFAQVVAENPFRDDAIDPSRLLVAFPRDPVRARARLASLARQEWTPDRFALGEHAAYLWCVDGITESELLKHVGRALGDGVTTRNWATVTKIGSVL